MTPDQLPTRDEIVRRAAEVVYENYGANLAAFWREAFAAVVEKHGDPADPHIVDGNCIHRIPICRPCQLTTIEAHLKDKESLAPDDDEIRECAILLMENDGSIDSGWEYRSLRDHEDVFTEIIRGLLNREYKEAEETSVVST